MFIPLRVGDSFVADANNFGQAVIYGVDNGVAGDPGGARHAQQHASSRRQAVEYAYDHGVAVIASAADEAAQHHNWPSNYPHTIVVNSVTQYDARSRRTSSYLQFNGCTNFSTQDHASRSRARAARRTRPASAPGSPGLVYSAALNAIDDGDLDPHPDLRAASAAIPAR